MKLMSFLAASLLAATLTACSGGGEAGKIRVALDWIPNTNHTGLIAAIDNGYYEEAGLDVTLLEPASDSSTLSVVASGGAEFGISAQDSMLAALTSDTPFPIKAVATLIQHNTSGILSLKESGITSPKSMAGHTYATWDLPVEQATIRTVIERDGGDYDKIVMIPNTVTDVLSALQTDIDAVWIFYAWDGVAANVKGLETNYFYFKDLDPSLDFYTPVFVSSDSFLAENPDTAKKFLDATRRGYEYAIENPEESAAMLCAYAPETDPDIALESQLYLAREYKSDVQKWGEIDGERWDAFFDWCYENDIIAEKLPRGHGFTNDFLG
jgi:ABC-type nitrate/sulfonate/bicarbonate transport system substrate-binding protein